MCRVTGSKPGRQPAKKPLIEAALQRDKLGLSGIASNFRKKR